MTNHVAWQASLLDSVLLLERFSVLAGFVIGLGSFVPVVINVIADDVKLGFQFRGISCSLIHPNAELLDLFLAVQTDLLRAFVVPGSAARRRGYSGREIRCRL